MSSTQLRVLHVSPSFHPAYSYGGPTESSYQLSRFLARAGCDVRVLTTNADGAARVVDVDTTRELELEERLHVRYCKRRAVHSVSPELLARLPSAVKAADIVQLNAVYSFPSIPTLFGALLFDRPVVWSARGALQRWENVRRPREKAVWEAACRAVAPRRMALHFTSEEERAQSAKRFPSARAVVVPNGVVIPDVPPTHVESPVLRLLALGRLHPIKGLENLLDAGAALRDGGFGPFTLTLAGAGDQDYVRTLERRVSALSLGSIVQLVGDVRGVDKARLFGDSDVLVAPSFTENFGIAIAEALAHGVPVIAGRGTPWRDLTSKEAGLWVDNDAASLAAAVRGIAAMDRAGMGARGRAWVTREFGWERAAASIMAVYDQLLRDGGDSQTPAHG